MTHTDTHADTATDAQMEGKCTNKTSSLERQNGNDVAVLLNDADVNERNFNYLPVYRFLTAASYQQQHTNTRI